MSSAVAPRGADNVKLPLWHTIRLSYARYFSNFFDVLRISWLWMVVLVPLKIIATWQQSSRTVVFVTNADSQVIAPGTPLGTRSLGSIVFGSVYFLIFLLAFVSIAVAWHRCIILGEHPRLSGSNLVSKTLWQYAIMFVLVALPSLVILLPTFFILQSTAHSLGWLAVLFGVSFYLVAIAVTLRLSPLLPARAIGNQRHLNKRGVVPGEILGEYFGGL